MDNLLRPVSNVEPPGGAEPFFELREGAEPWCFDMRNLHRLVPSIYREANAVALKVGGRNPRGEPNYRVVWGWEHPIDYVGKTRDFFYMQRWLPPEVFTSELEWEMQQRRFYQEEPEWYEPMPYPREGDYFTVRKCQWAVLRQGRKVGVFRWPDAFWVEGAIIANRLQMGRTPGEIKGDVKATIAHQNELRKDELRRVQDEFGIRDIQEHMTHLLIRNPSLRKDPSLLLSPAVAPR